LSVQSIDSVVNTREVAAALKISVRTLKRWIAEGLFPKPAKLGGRNLWRAADVNRFLAQEAQRHAG
jgi:excisionase family DNA binding protein